MSVTCWLDMSSCTMTLLWLMVALSAWAGAVIRATYAVEKLAGNTSRPQRLPFDTPLWASVKLSYLSEQDK